MAKARVVFFTRYTRLGPSSRLRSYQYQSLLEGKGYEVVMCPLFNDQYIKDLYAKNPSKSKSNAIRCYLRRFIQILRFVRRRNHIVMEKELLPYFPPVVEYLMKLLGIRYMVDIDDAIFHYYDRITNPLLRLVLNKKIDRVFKYSHVVLAGNDFLGERARLAGAKRIENYPTVIDVSDYTKRALSTRKSTDSHRPVVVGWIGSPSTVKYFQRIIPVLDELSVELDFVLRIVGSNVEFHVEHMTPEYIDWSEEEEVELISGFDIGIMALAATPFEKGKCGYKLIQYFGCAKPVIASPVGVNATIVEHGHNGFLADSPEEWKHYITQLVNDQAMRNDFGTRGHEKVTRFFNVERNLEHLVSILEE